MTQFETEKRPHAPHKGSGRLSYKFISTYWGAVPRGVLSVRARQGAIWASSAVIGLLKMDHKIALFYDFLAEFSPPWCFYHRVRCENPIELTSALKLLLSVTNGPRRTNYRFLCSLVSGGRSCLIKISCID